MTDPYSIDPAEYKKKFVFENNAVIAHPNCLSVYPSDEEIATLPGPLAATARAMRDAGTLHEQVMAGNEFILLAGEWTDR